MVGKDVHARGASQRGNADAGPMCAQEATAKIDEYARGMISGSGSTLFEELGLYYIGPIDGHNLDLIIAMLQGAPSLFYLSTVPSRSPLLGAAVSAQARYTQGGCPSLCVMDDFLGYQGLGCEIMASRCPT